MFKSIADYFSYRGECIKLRQQLTEMRSNYAELQEQYSKDLKEKDQWIHSLSQSIATLEAQNNRLYEALNKSKLLEKYEQN